MYTSFRPIFDVPSEMTKTISYPDNSIVYFDPDYTLIRENLFFNKIVSYPLGDSLVEEEKVVDLFSHHNILVLTLSPKEDVVKVIIFDQEINRLKTLIFPLFPGYEGIFKYVSWGEFTIIFETQRVNFLLDDPLNYQIADNIDDEDNLVEIGDDLASTWEVEDEDFVRLENFFQRYDLPVDDIFDPIAIFIFDGMKTIFKFSGDEFGETTVFLPPLSLNSNGSINFNELDRRKISIMEINEELEREGETRISKDVVIIDQDVYRIKSVPSGIFFLTDHDVDEKIRTYYLLTFVSGNKAGLNV